MSTRSAIGMEKKDGKVICIYCHFDGYPSGVGETLKNFYNSETKVKELIALGDISSLGPKLYPTGEHSFEKPEHGVTVAYGRDRGEKDTNPTIYPSAKEFWHKIPEDFGAEYGYLFIAGQWYFADMEYYYRGDEEPSKDEIEIL